MTQSNGINTPVVPKTVHIDNPLREMRLRLGWTLDKTARLMATSRQFIIRSEQAVYADPPPRLTELLLDHTEPNIPDLPNPGAVGVGMSDELIVYQLYHLFQVQTRRENYGKLITDFDFPIHPAYSLQHPFVLWRTRSGINARIGPSKLFCVHPALISKFEIRPHLCTTAPKELITALRDSGYDEELLDSFAQAYDTYKRALSEKYQMTQEQRERAGGNSP